MKKSMAIVGHVLEGSIAEEAGIEKGDKILSINEEEIKDIFDYRFLITNEELLLEIEKEDGEIWEIEVEKDEYEDLGIEFDNLMIDDAMSCKNKCVFCFIDQLPKGMRDTLYFKDDDSRLSFFMGNYVTLTNMTNEDLERIIRYRMSPINVSVHTTNSDLRILMLRNKTAGDVVTKIKRLIKGGITVNCQIVLCRDMNDKEELSQSIEDLAMLYPGVKSISIVPVGITKHREGLCELLPYDREASIEVIHQVEKWQKRLLQKFQSRVVFLADEFYTMSGQEIPSYDTYEEFPQIENGVGFIAMLRKEFYDALGEIPKKSHRERTISIATGVSAYPYIRELGNEMEKIFPGLTVSVYQIKNEYFGENVTVAGLLTGQDLVGQLLGKDLGSELLICRCMLKAGENIFLDNYTVDDVKEKLGVAISVVENNGKDFVEKVLGITSI